MPDQNYQVKIKNSAKQNERDIKKALNLNQVLFEAKNKAKSKSIGVWIGLCVILMAICLVLASQIFLFAPKQYSQFQKFVPQSAKAVFLFKVSELNNLTPMFLPYLEQNSSFYNWLKDRVQKFLYDSQISSQEIYSALNDDTMFLVPASSSNASPIWAIIAQSKTGADGQEPAAFAKAENGLRQNFGLNELYYRQVKINSAYSLNNIKKAYYFSRIGNYIFVSNNLETLQSLIDSALEK